MKGKIEKREEFRENKKKSISMVDGWKKKVERTEIGKKRRVERKEIREKAIREMVREEK